MKITFIHHASFLLTSDLNDVQLLTDPWYVGSAFLGGWDLMWPIDVGEKEIGNPKFVWLSHEHPDHFSIQTIKKMVERFENTTFLYQETRDCRLISWLESNGFKTREMRNGHVETLSDSTKMLVRTIGTGDSYCVVEMDSKVFVNTNDAILLPSDLKQLEADTGLFKAVDVLTTQFGIAGKVGNGPDHLLREEESRKIRDLVVQQINTIRPEFFIPSASMKVFSRSDNFYMNRGQSSLASLYKLVSEQTKSVPLFLNSLDTWAFDAAPDPAVLITRFDSVLETSSKAALTPMQDQSVSTSEVQDAIQNWWERQRNFHSRLALLSLRFLPGGFRIQHLAAHLTDIDENVWVIPPLFGTKDIQALEKTLCIQVSSPVLQLALKDDFGLMSLIISARFEGSQHNQKVLRTTAWISSQQSAGQPISIFSLLKSTLRGLSFILRRGKTL